MLRRCRRPAPTKHIARTPTPLDFRKRLHREARYGDIASYMAQHGKTRRARRAWSQASASVSEIHDSEASNHSRGGVAGQWGLPFLRFR